jgi:hypothetical protein
MVKRRRFVMFDFLKVPGVRVVLKKSPQTPGSMPPEEQRGTPPIDTVESNFRVRLILRTPVSADKLYLPFGCGYDVAVFFKEGEP